MNIQRWIARREPDWKRLTHLLDRAESKGIKSLNASELRQLASLYRSVSADLARMQTHDASQTLKQELLVLTSRAYSQVYQGSQKQEWQAVRQFYQWDLPAVVRETWVYTAIATATFLIAGLVAWWFCWRDPVFLSLTVPEHLIVQVRDRGELWMGSIVGIEPMASSRIAQNNILVSLGAIAGGITAGLYTLFILAYNGLFIGAVATLVGQNNLAYPFWAFVFPHGSLELPAIFFSGGAGLLIARAILFPGRFRRTDALKYYGLKAAQLLYGIVPLLLIAGAIEGFFSPNPLVPSPLKYIAGVLLFWGLLAYCRRERSI